MTNINKLNFLGLILASTLLFSCGTDNNDADEISTTDTTDASKSKDTKAQNVFYSIPSPVETTSLLKAAGAKYNKNYLNPIENLSKYESVKAKALNLGVYGSDLSFTSMFDQTQESMLYLRCTNTLASKLGISGAFDEKTTERIEANMSNRDSLLGIISDSYWTADAYLKDNGQPGVSALIIAGGWIEGLYIATQIAQTTKSEAITTRIGEQKLSLENLIALLESHKSENEGIAEVMNSLVELKKIYDTVSDTAGETTVSTDKEKGITTIGNGSSYSINADQLKQITEKAKEIRNKIIQ
jgi:hypothetical protein